MTSPRSSRGTTSRPFEGPTPRQHPARFAASGTEMARLYDPTCAARDSVGFPLPKIPPTFFLPAFLYIFLGLIDPSRGESLFGSGLPPMIVLPSANQKSLALKLQEVQNGVWCTCDGNCSF